MMMTTRCSALAAAIGLTLMAGAAAYAQQQKHTPRGQPTVVTAEDFAAVVATLGKQQNIDKVVHTVGTNGPAGNISVAAVAYNAGAQHWDGVANEHSMITEVFYVTKGSATFVFGGDLENAKEFDNNFEAVKKVFGPGQGGKVKGHRIIRARVGDSVILPPNTPHNIIRVTEDFEMVVVRIDPANVLEVDARQPPSAVAAAPSRGPWIGTWKRNAEKSKGAASGSAVFRMWEEADGVGYSFETTSDAGAPVSMGGFARFDGKQYPEQGNPVADHNAFTRIDDRTYSVVDYKGGKETIRFTITISPDGKTRTSVGESTNAKGEKVTSIGVWDRV